MELGRRFEELQCDLSTDVDFEAVVAEATGKSEKIDILVNNAGTIHRADFLDVAKAEWDRVMNINLRSVFFLTQAVARQMIKSRIAGRIINIASLLSFQGGIRIAAYTASKHGVAGLTRLLANELAAARHHRQCDRSWLYGDRQHGSTSRRPDTFRQDSRPYSHAAMGPTCRSGNGGIVPGFACEFLCHRNGHTRRWRLACKIDRF